MSDVDQLTDIYRDITGGTESTTEQQEQRGSWQPTGEATTSIADTVAEMRDRYGIRTQLLDDQLVTLVRGYFQDRTDTEIARDLGDPSLDKTVTRARLRLHLFRETDTTADFDLEALKQCFEAGHSGAECARRLDLAKSTANRYRRIFEAEAEANAVDNQYYERFQRYCTGDIEDTVTTELTTDDGLQDAVDGAGADNPQLQ